MNTPSGFTHTSTSAKISAICSQPIAVIGQAPECQGFVRTARDAAA
jgi:hypothetical protein